MKPYRILLAEDHLLFRELIKKSLEEIADIEVVGEVSDGLQLLESIKVLKPQMVILDIGMPFLSGLEAAKIIKQDYPKIKVLLLTMYKSKDFLKHALEAKVDGYLLKEDAFKDLLVAIEMIRKGKFYISNIISQKIKDLVLHKTWSEAPLPGDLSDNEIEGVESRIRGNLSQREIEVLKYFTQGKSYLEISELLSISCSTARNHLSKIKKKLLIKRNIDLVKYAIKKGYVPISP
jgi:DNA-binding NarL/FixJ family response regulator